MKIRIRVLSYGESGSGKTELIRTWPLNIKEGEWAAVFDFDGGLATLRNPITGQLPEGFFGITFRDSKKRPQQDQNKLQREATAFKNARLSLEELTSGEGRNEFIPEEIRNENDWNEMPSLLVIDTLTGLHDAAMNMSLTLDPKTGLAGAPAMHHWGAQMRLVEEFVKMCEAYDWHLHVTAHVQTKHDDVIGTTRGTILATGQKSPGLIPGWFDEVYYHTTRSTDKGIRYVVKTKNDGFFVAKSRLKVIDEAELDVTMPDQVLKGKEPANTGEYGFGKIFKLLEEQYGS
jgi:hypothetical protein